MGGGHVAWDAGYVAWGGPRDVVRGGRASVARKNVQDHACGRS
ncbi:hypothetical protein STTU_1567 [Streptomyces sp. Tu6071]|nr:hypothetical protein STTU_1567 [Streptomyces sp. Tu6071]